jgi:hypothetical protein
VLVRHAVPDTLSRIAPLLAQIRARSALREGRPGVFELNSRAFLHFHDDPSGVFADVRLAEGFVRMRVTTSSEQADLPDRIDDCLSTVESRDTERRRPRGESKRGRA